MSLSLESVRLLTDKRFDEGSLGEVLRARTTARRRRTWAAVVAFAGVVGVLLAIVRGDVTGQQQSTAESLEEEGSIPAGLAIMVANEYSSAPSTSDYPFLEGKLLVEPHKTTTLTALGGLATKGGTLSWEVARVTLASDGSTSQQVLLVEAGAQVSYIFTSLGTYEISLSLTKFGLESQVVRKIATCRYVRRELRKLTDSDREAFINSVVTMGTTTASDGVNKYGGHFRNLHYFTARHVDLSSAFNADAMHDGMGFLLNHVSMTSEFEMSLQAIAPQISVPYWDFTWDSYRMGAPGTYSPEIATALYFGDDMWSSSWFGEINTELGKNDIATGRLSSIEIPTMEQMLKDSMQSPGSNALATTATPSAAKSSDPSKLSPIVRNPYGLLRSPWNTNKNPKVLRGASMCGVSAFEFQGMPSCTHHHQMIWDEDLQTWYDWSWAISYFPHGPVHLVVGGMHNCEKTFDDLAASDAIDVNEADLKRLRLGAFYFAKTGFMTGEITCPSLCTEDTPQEDCVCSCAGDLDERIYGAGNTLSDHKALLLWDSLGVGTFATQGDYSDTDKRTIVRAICDMHLMPGDASSASSPADISFWPMHPTLERLWQWRKLANKLTDERWLDPDADLKAGEKTTFCKTAQSECKGHHADDLMPFGTAIVQDHEAAMLAAGTLTLGELYQIMDPAKDALPYVYDSFEWDHCAAVGYDFRVGLAAGQSKADVWTASKIAGATAVTQDSDRIIASASSPN